MEERRQAEYHSKDFEWDELRAEVEDDPSLSHHFLSFQSQPSSSSSETLPDSDAWKRFHTRHSSGKFFKERRYLLKEFPELVSCKDNSKVLEVGCGSGSTVLSILRGNESIVVYTCDCSTEILVRAKEIVDESKLVALENRFHPFYCDLSRTGFPSWLACEHCQDLHPRTQQTHLSDVKDDSYSLKEAGCCIGGVDFITLIFTLSAIPLKDMPVSIKECFSVLKPGGLLLFRDYGLYDMTMSMTKDSDLGNTCDQMLELDYCCIKSLNRRNGKSMRRVWVHGKFQKPV